MASVATACATASTSAGAAVVATVPVVVAGVVLATAAAGAVDVAAVAGRARTGGTTTGFVNSVFSKREAVESALLLFCVCVTSPLKEVDTLSRSAIVVVFCASGVFANTSFIMRSIESCNFCRLSWRYLP